MRMRVNHRLAGAAVVLLAATWASVSLAAESKATNTPSAPSPLPALEQSVASAGVITQDERMQWWREARFGMFIHWGLYAIPAGEWQGKAIPGGGEWIMHEAKVPVEEYEQLAGQFNPTKFNAKDWVEVAKKAGMKYITITSKHHDGFAMFQSSASNIFCGKDPHRFAASYAKLPQLDFLDLGWGGDVVLLRRHLPRTFFNIRLDPVSILQKTPAEIREILTRLVRQSDNPWLTGVCCINMDQNVTDAQIAAIFETVAELRGEYQREEALFAGGKPYMGMGARTVGKGPEQ